MKTAWVAMATVAALAVQTTLLHFVVPVGLAVDLVLVVVVYAALTSGPATGLLTGAFAGLVQDAMSSGVVGVGGLTKTIVGFLVGIVGAQFIVTQLPVRFVVFAAASLLHAILFAGFYLGLGLQGFGITYTVALGQAVFNAAVGVVAFQLVELLPGTMARRRQARLRR